MVKKNEICIANVFSLKVTLPSRALYFTSYMNQAVAAISTASSISTDTRRETPASSIVTPSN